MFIEMFEIYDVICGVCWQIAQFSHRMVAYR
jgi:hypothetical protein